jgi:hypothetical protein
MKAWGLILFFVLIQVSIAGINTLGVFETGTPGDTQKLYTWNTTMNDQSVVSYGNGTTQSSASLSFGDLTKGLWMFGKIVGTGIAFPYTTFILFGVSKFWAGLMSIPIYGLYLLGLVQFIRGQSVALEE